MSHEILLKVATYNILASSYIRQEYYPFTQKIYLQKNERIPMLVKKIGNLGCDILCLQEIEKDTYECIDKNLSALGYSNHLAMKGGNRPDGCATFFLKKRLSEKNNYRLEYDEGLGSSPSDHIAQLSIFKHDGIYVGVANTHLKWDPPNLPKDQKFGYQQIRELLSIIQTKEYQNIPWVICGDLNVESKSDAVELLESSGYTYTHKQSHFSPTCNSNGKTKMIDFIFHDNRLNALPLEITPINNETPLPSSTEPSDHLPVISHINVNFMNEEPNN